MLQTTIFDLNQHRTARSHRHTCTPCSSATMNASCAHTAARITNCAPPPATAMQHDHQRCPAQLGRDDAARRASMLRWKRTPKSRCSSAASTVTRTRCSRAQRAKAKMRRCAAFLFSFLIGGNHPSSKFFFCESSRVRCESRELSSRAFQRYPARSLGPTGSQITRSPSGPGDP